MIVGLFRRSPRGSGSSALHSSTDRSEQIYIPPEAAGDASSGDEVAVKITKRSRRPGMNTRGGSSRSWPAPRGSSSGPISRRRAPASSRSTARPSTTPIYVGDPGAKGAKPGDKVALEMVRYPTPYLEGEGVITEILGQRGQPGVDTLTVIRAFNIPDTFDDAVLDEAREQAKMFNEDEIGERLDLRERADRDDRPGHRARLRRRHLAVARRAGLLEPGRPHRRRLALRPDRHRALDRSARQRGTSVYLPDRVIPMLPEILSNSLASLQAGRTRYTVSAFLEFNPEGILTVEAVRTVGDPGRSPLQLRAGDRR